MFYIFNLLAIRGYTTKYLGQDGAQSLPCKQILWFMKIETVWYGKFEHNHVTGSVV